MRDTQTIAKRIEQQLWQDCRCTLQDATPTQLYRAVSAAARREVMDRQDAAAGWAAGTENRGATGVRAAGEGTQETGCELRAAGEAMRNLVPFGVRAAGEGAQEPGANCAPQAKRACYLSAEFLLGRMVTQNLLNMGWLEPVRELLRSVGRDLDVFEEIEDMALGNGGLGRLAACFLDSAATQGIPLDGYGIRYRYGLFKQSLEHGFQEEFADDWQRFGDPWSSRCDEDSVAVRIGRDTVTAVPYDMPCIGYGQPAVNRLRLWQAESPDGFDFSLFNQQKYDAAVRKGNRAEDISRVLYPNDDTDRGKKLRLAQQYFFSSASIQDLLRTYRRTHGETDFTAFPRCYAIQLNDTHPVVAIPEFLRLLSGAGVPFDEALALCRETFAYTNHTILPEALEKWDVKLFRSVLPQVYPVVVRLQQALERELNERGIVGEAQTPYAILDGAQIHMARLAIFATHATNGVAHIHTELLKTQALPAWYALYPERFHNVTNGVTQRRWLALCNPALALEITSRIGSGWLTRLSDLQQMEAFSNDETFLRRLHDIRQENKRRLCAYVQKQDGISLPEGWLFDVQIKRLHEYKRQLMNAFSILDLYWGLKEGRVTDFQPTVFLFGAKAAPGYRRAKGIIRYILELARLVNGDPVTRDCLRVAFVSNYNVSYAERLIPAADFSEQISTAGTEASGTSNMKFMLNGALTIGTFDGANIEIVEQAGEENNYIFGLRVEEIDRLRADGYDPQELCAREPRVRRAVDSLIDGTFDDGGTGVFRELYDALMTGASWHQPDHFFLLPDLLPYTETRLRANREARDTLAFYRKGLHNLSHAGYFSSDRAVRQYARDIWNI